MDATPLALIVDDIAINRKSISMLISDDFEIMEADSAEECFRCIKSFTPDIVLLDVIMPTISGDEVCYNLKIEESTKDIPIVFITSMSQSEYEQRFGDVKADGYLEKPVDEASLNLLIESLLAR